MLEVFDRGEAPGATRQLAVTTCRRSIRRSSSDPRERRMGNIHLPEDTFHTTGYWFCVALRGRRRRHASARAGVRLVAGLANVIGRRWTEGQ